MKKTWLLACFIIIWGISFCGVSLLNSKAEENNLQKVIIYYKSIEIQAGDSLWTIAEEYAPHTGMTTKEYIKELKQMNDLKKDIIHAGCHLTVMYTVYEE